MNQQPVTPVSADMRFRAYEAYFREYLTEKLYRNVFNAACFLQVLLGSAFMADIAKGWVAGLASTAIASYIFVYNPSATSRSAREQSVRYEKIIHHLNTLTDAEISSKFSSLCDTDSRVPDRLMSAAYILADTAIHGATEKTMILKNNLTYSERLVVLISGCLIKTK
ncbi:hypothetical protein [Salmonella enterica]|uniref:hypothetical protein n=1 Tax=Salmonella enterica TaxID=28901 RepID=UPI0009AA5B9E|nr:hypothetical protein [Salmonella enterica]